MKPVEIFGIVFVGRWQRKPPVTINVNDVFDASSGFRECETPVLDDRGLAEWIEVFDRLWREDRGALVEN
jgi:hypothetical protein